MNCENIKEKLSLYIDNMLDLNESEEIREHIENCDNCREYYNHLLKLEKMVDDFAVSDNEQHWEAQRDKVLDKIEQAESEKIIKVQSVKKRNQYYKYLAVAASIALVAFVSIYESQEFNQFNSMFNDSEVPMAPVSIEEKTILGGEVESIDARNDINLNGDEKSPVISTLSNKKKPAFKSQAVPENIRRDLTLNGIESDYKVMKPLSAGSSLKLGEVDVVSTDDDLGGVLQTLDVSPRANSVKSLSFDGPNANIKKNIMESHQEKLKRADVGLNGRGVDDRAAMSFESDEGKNNFPELRKDKDSGISEINIYKIRLDSLEDKFEGIYSPHYRESSAKGRVGIPPDSLNTVILELAETCFQVGILSLDENEREDMIEKLRRLAVNGNPESIEKIQRYIVLLLSAK